MIKLLRRSQAFVTYFKWYDALSRRERSLVDISQVLFAFALVYLAIATPVMEFRNANVDKHQSELSGLQWMQQHAGDPAVQQSADGNASGNTKLSVVSNSANLSSITLNRLQPTPAGINIDIRSAPFNNVVEWLLKLETSYGFKIVEARFERREDGLASSQIRIR